MTKKLFQNFTRISIIVVVICSLSGFNRLSKATDSNNILNSVIRKHVSPDLEIIRKRIIDDLLQPPVNDEEILKLVNSIKPDGSWPGINYKDTSRTGFQHKDHLEHMLDLARAYKKPGFNTLQKC
jgi:chondroitin AC lyase